MIPFHFVWHEACIPCLVARLLASAPLLGVDKSAGMISWRLGDMHLSDLLRSSNGSMAVNDELYDFSSWYFRPK